MTDKEIIEGLAHCFNMAEYSDCNDCPYRGTKGKRCTHALYEDVISLINHQQAEIERLNKETKMLADIDKMYSGIKAELINIFVEVLKEKASSKVMVVNGKEVYGTKIYSITEIGLEKLVKEMEGRNETLVR